MKIILYPFCLVMLFASCSSNGNENDPEILNLAEKNKFLYINSVIVTDSNQFNKEQISMVVADSFAISLERLKDSSGYIAQNITREAAIEKGAISRYSICDWCGAEIKFSSITGFLSFMSAKGYELSTADKRDNRIDYRFIKNIKPNC
jgi:hypothetical protein